MRKVPHWLEAYSPDVSVDILRELAHSHAAQLPQGLREHITGLIARCDFRRLVEYSVDYEAGLSAHQVYHLRQALAFFQKLEPLECGYDKAAEALKSFESAEALCRETNAIFRARARGEFSFSPRVESVLFRAQQKISRVLGRRPEFSELGLRFGPGATTLTKKREASLRAKFSDGLACSEELFPVVKPLLAELPTLLEACSVYERVDEDGEHWAAVNVMIHDGVLSFVPKNAKTNRSIVVEPVLNGVLQLALGDHISRRLAAFGVDLRDQTRNQTLALQGSLTGALATLDLKSASDTVAIELVYDLLPLEWATLLAYCRSGHIVHPNGSRVTLEKFSSMGNGYTFALESLIFWAITKSCCDDADIVSVYGDDIICPTSAYDLVVECLTACGFIVNKEKSYASGPFRESCGSDYYSGIDVRPYYQKVEVSARTLFTLHNFYVRRGDFERAAMVKSFIHPSLRIFGPDGFGDGHLVQLGYRRETQRRLAKRGYSGYTFDTFVSSPRRDKLPTRPGDRVLPGYSVYRRNNTWVLPPDVLQRLFSPSAWDNADGIRVASLFLRGHGRAVENLPIPEVGDDRRKALSLPGSDEYHRVSVYTF